jgi:predicted HAD superfamily Cof-like phosphohydrolase
MTNFQKVSSWNDYAGNKKPSKPEIPDTATVELCLDLITEEVSELVEAIIERDLTAIIDAVGDILYVTYGLAHRFGIDADRAVQEVHMSNLSKFCVTNNDANKTLDKYYDLAIPAKKHLVNGLYVIRNTDTGKILKGVRFKEPSFKGLF